MVIFVLSFVLGSLASLDGDRESTSLSWSLVLSFIGMMVMYFYDQLYK